MKTIMITFWIFLCMVFFAVNPVNSYAGDSQPGSIGFVAKLGFDTAGEIEGDFSDFGGPTDTGDIKSGFSLAFDGLMNFQAFMLGIGVSYLLPRAGEGTDAPDGKFGTVPIYGVVNIPFSLNQMTPFIAVQLGYNFLIIDSTMKKWYETVTGGADISTEGGLYYAIGGGVIFDNNIQVELLYRVNQFKIVGKIAGASGEIEAEYTHFTLSVGYRF